VATRADLDAIDEAIRKLVAGERVTSVQFSNYSVQYDHPTLGQLRAERSRILAEIGAEDGTQRPRAYRARHSKGL